MHFPHIPLFRIWYSTTYTILFLILLVLCAITPGDHIYQSIRYNNRRNAFVIAGVYALTALIAISIYSTRLYTNRSVLQAIPKSYIPVEVGEVGKSVRRIIVRNLERSALIAWDSRPRDFRPEIQENGITGPGQCQAEKRGPVLKKKTLPRQSTIIPIHPKFPPWGHVSHPGWSAPHSEDLTDLQYWNVIPELPNLIEAKAVSLAPPDPVLRGIPFPGVGNTGVPDARILCLLQRPSNMGLREYLGRLGSFGLIDPPELGTHFLAQYEYARFSTNDLNEQEFRDLMSIFSDLLSSMTALDEEVMARFKVDSDAQSFASTESSAIHYVPQRLSEHPRSLSTYSGNTSTHSEGVSPGTMRTAPSQRRGASSGYLGLERTPSASTSSLGSVQRHPVRDTEPTDEYYSSASSLRSKHSVIRLTPSPNIGDPPYQLNLLGS